MTEALFPTNKYRKYMSYEVEHEGIRYMPRDTHLKDVILYSFRRACSQNTPSQMPFYREYNIQNIHIVKQLWIWAYVSTKCYHISKHNYHLAINHHLTTAQIYIFLKLTPQSFHRGRNLYGSYIPRQFLRRKWFPDIDCFITDQLSSRASRNINPFPYRHIRLLRTRLPTTV